MNQQATTNNITALNKDVEIIKKHFSHCFDKNGNFDLEKFKNELSKNEIDFSNESYGMDWLGKSYARLLASDEATTLLKEDKKWNDQPQNTNSQNLLIKGDNLEVLKHLSSAYYEKVKMIYIDPPYNTGSDGFVYQDDRKFTVEEFRKLAGVDEEKAKRILDFVDSKSNSHSAWLTFMYPRLYIAKQLLMEDGVIFVSIDDNEIAQLRISMDEIFGEDNFIATLKWNRTVKAPSLSDSVRTKFEYILVYTKGIRVKFFGKESYNKQAPLLNQPNKQASIIFPPKSIRLPNSISKGFYSEKYQVDVPQLIIEENGLNKETIIIKARFKWGQNRVNEYLDKGSTFQIKKDPSTIYMDLIADGNYISPSDILSKDENDVGRNEDAQKELDAIGIPFSFAKPSSLVKYLIKTVTYNCADATILDFFAGSGTTGDAVMQLNSDDGGNRSYILVQLPEEIDKKKNKVAYNFVKNELSIDKPTVFDITKARLIRTGKKIQKDNKDLKEPKDLSNVDFGFKVFETTPIWEGYDLDAEDFDSQMELFNENKLSDEDLQTLLTTWKTYDGVPLTQNVVAIDLDGYVAFYLDTRLYLMNKGFGTKNLKKLLDEIDVNNDFNPRTVVAFGYNFESKMLRELAENIKNYANKKEIDIDFIARY